MGSTPYLIDLTARLAEGLSALPDELRSRHVGYLRASQAADGGFTDRTGGSDLYYTAFGLRALAVLDALTPDVGERAAGYLRSQMTAQTSVVDFFSFLTGVAILRLAGGPDVLDGAAADWPDRVVEMLGRFRTPDGGYNKVPGATSGSTYHTFLVGLCFELLERPIPSPEEVTRFVRSRWREDGGFVEVSAMRRSGTNPTAAAAGILELTGGFDDETRSQVIEYLLELRSDEGGLCANGRVPLADLLSTFTGCWTLARLGAFDRLKGSALRAYVTELDRPGGGFRAGLWDDGHDVEYTFYGLGVLGLVGAAGSMASASM
jgi:geranylgeranyl transferase type-2 subunit beta